MLLFPHKTEDLLCMLVAKYLDQIHIEHMCVHVCFCFPLSERACTYTRQLGEGKACLKCSECDSRADSPDYSSAWTGKVSARRGGGHKNASGTSSPADVTPTHRQQKERGTRGEAQLVSKIRAEVSEGEERGLRCGKRRPCLGGKDDSGARREPG